MTNGRTTQTLWGGAAVAAVVAAAAAAASWRDAFWGLLKWFGKSKTAFYQLENMVLPWWFGLFCFNYSIAGMAFWWAKPSWANQSIYPYTPYCLHLIFVQGPLAFMADYRNMTKESIFHVLDRCSATVTAIVELWKVYLMRHDAHPAIYRAYLGVVCFSLLSYAKAQQSIAQGNAWGCVVWHNGWHMGALAAAVLMAYQRILTEKEEKRKRCKKDKEQDNKITVPVPTRSANTKRSPPTKKPQELQNWPFIAKLRPDSWVAMLMAVAQQMYPKA